MLVSPDGDLGSSTFNIEYISEHIDPLLPSLLDEILLSSDKTITIIDGSGVAHDPLGLDRAELVRLAKARQMVSNFDKSKLSNQGYVILVEEKDRVLPSQ